MKKGQKGFTLIELLIVVAILGVLAAIAVPRFAGVSTTEAKTAVDNANVRALQSAVELWNFKHPLAKVVSIADLGANVWTADGGETFVPDYVKEIPVSPNAKKYKVSATSVVTVE